MNSHQYKLIPTQHANTQIYSFLRKDIVCCRINPGTVLSEKEVSERFDVSRQPVREAFIKLAGDGLIEIRPQRGSYVCKISLSHVQQLSFIRETIESEIAKRAAILANHQQITALEEKIEQQKVSARRNNTFEFFELDDDFHRLLANIARCGLAWDIIDNNKAPVDRVRFISLGSITAPELIVPQHARIVDAIKNKKSDEAALFMKIHLNEISETLKRVYENNASWFIDDL